MSESSNSAWPFGEISDEEGLDIAAIFKDSAGTVDQGNPFASPVEAAVPAPAPEAQEPTAESAEPAPALEPAAAPAPIPKEPETPVASASKPIQGKNHLDSSKADVERNLKEIVINGTESLDGSSIQGEWFPEINADIFISHSRDDADLANGIAGWINSNFNLHCFIDSNVWGYSDELLEKLNSRYSNKRPNSNGGYLYDHQSCINASKHVDTMLTIALHKMINRCECVILLNTGNAISRMKKYEDLQRDTTFSPWIYSELICSSLIQQRRPERHSSQGMQGTQNFDAVNESLQIAYEVPTKHLLPLDPKTLSAWKAAYVGNKLHPLDVLYNQFPQIQKNILNG